MVLGVLRCGFFLAAAAALSGCSTYKEVSGSSLLLDVTPRPPSFAGAYDFDLLEQVGGKACITRGNNSSTYWLGMTELAKLSSDSLTREAIAAAAFDAISRLDEADTLVLTRVVAEGNGVHRVCATVYGRGVRLKKAAPLLPTAERNTTKPVASPGDDEPTDKHDEE